MSSGDLDAALALCDEAIGLFPDSAVFPERKARTLQRMGRLAEAESVLATLSERFPEDPTVLMALGSVRLSARQFDAADEAFQRVLRQKEDHIGAVLGCAKLALARRGALMALEVIEQRLSLPTAGITNPDVVLDYVELAMEADDKHRLQVGMTWAADCLHRLSGPQLVRLAKAALHCGNRTIARDALAAIALSKQNQITPALFLLQQTQAAGNPELAESLFVSLKRKFTERQAARFQTEASLILFGPDMALQEFRKVFPARRSAGDALLMGKLLVAARFGEKTFRYLRLCRRKWPGQIQFRVLYMNACINCGRFEEAKQELALIEKQDLMVDTKPIRAQLLTLSGALQEVDEVFQGEHDTQSPVALFRRLICLERYDEATALYSNNSTRSSKHGSTVPKLGDLHHAFLLELKKYRDGAATLKASGCSSEEIDRKLAPDNFFAAKHVVERWQKAQPAPKAGTKIPHSIPRKIFQHWNSVEVPLEVDAIMDSWRSEKRYEHSRFKKSDAISFLSGRFGQEHVRAFNAAGNYAEGSDFLRLFYLLAEGGVYSDADNRLTGDLDNLLEGQGGLVLFPWLPVAPVANHAFFARPGHPLLKIAAELALKSLLAHEETNTWFKTGPGLLTRATAIYLLNTPAEEAQNDLNILSYQQVVQFLTPVQSLPYKSTGSYWAAKENAFSELIVETMQSLVDQDTGGAGITLEG